MINKVLFVIIFLIISLEKNELLSNGVLESSINNKYRSEKNKKRDLYRNPYETLSFFEVSSDKKILEIIPGRGWYTEILSNYMNSSNNFYVLMYEKPKIDNLKKIQNEYLKFFSENGDKFGKIKDIYFDDNFNIIHEADFFDLALTFRNTHNWLKIGKAEKAFKSINRVLKKDGILGVVQHRGFEDSKEDFLKGYVKEKFLIKLIEEQGFKLIKSSEINSNNKDLKNYEKGVWTLPPRLVDGAKDKYLIIGESDRMTLKFRKL